MKSVDILGYFAATLTTLSFLPQALLTLRTRDTAALSLTMYSAFTLGVLCWLIYGIYTQNNVIVFANSITFVLASLILGFKLYNTFFAHALSHSRALKARNRPRRRKKKSRYS